MVIDVVVVMVVVMHSLVIEPVSYIRRFGRRVIETAIEQFGKFRPVLVFIVRD